MKAKRVGYGLALVLAGAAVVTPLVAQAATKTCSWRGWAKATMHDSAFITAVGPGAGPTATETRADATWLSKGTSPSCWGWVGSMQPVLAGNSSYCYANGISNNAHVQPASNCYYTIGSNGPDYVWYYVQGHYCWSENFKPHRHGCFDLRAQLANWYWGSFAYDCYVPAGGYIHPDYDLKCAGNRALTTSY